jgi:hypothetical protein
MTALKSYSYGHIYLKIYLDTRLGLQLRHKGKWMWKFGLLALEYLVLF